MADTQPTPVALYLRFSSEMQRDGYSIAFQDRVCRDWCDRNDAVVADIYKDEAYSASTNDRPDFQRLLAECRKPVGQRKFQAVVFFHTWRFSRSMDDAPLLTQIERAGIRLYSATEPMDTSTASGKFMRNVSLSVGQYQLDQLREATTEGKITRAQGDEKRGIVPHSNASMPPFGYSRVAKTVGDHTFKEDIPNDRATWVTQAFEHYAVGQASDMDIARWLNNHGVRTPYGRPFSKDTVRVMLKNKFYAGFVAYRGMSNEWTEEGHRKRNPRSKTIWTRGAHQPIVAEELYERCQAVRRDQAKRQVGRRPAEKHVYLLNGLSICAKCGKKLGCSTGSGNTKENYRCKSRERGIECTARQSYVQQAKLIPYIDDMIEQLQLSEEIIDKAVELSQSEETIHTSEKHHDELNAELRRLSIMFQKGGVEEDYYDAELKRIQAEIAALAPVEPRDIQRAAQIIDGLYDAWKDMSNEEKGATLHTLLVGVVVDIDAGAVVEWQPRREFAHLFAAIRL